VAEFESLNQGPRESAPSRGMAPGAYARAKTALAKALLRINPALSLTPSGAVGDLSPNPHPRMGRVCSLFEPCWLGDATGWGAKPVGRRDPSRCTSGTLRLA
jgi:hypothetical protein